MIKEGWKKYIVGDVAEVFTGFPFKGSKYSDCKGVRVVRGENVSIGKLRWDTIKFWDEDYEEKYRLEEGDIVIGMDGSRVGKNKAQIKKEDLPLLLAQRVARLRSTDTFDQDYLSYIINNERFENYVSIVQTGTTIPHISSKQIKGYDFLGPKEKEEQTNIASILSSLDDKIELNLQTNKTLESIAQAIFKEWFVDFRFPGFDGVMVDGIPKGWREGVISDIYKTTSGGTPSRSREDFYIDGTIKWVKSKELNGGFIFDTEERITEQALKNSSAKIIPKYSVLVAMYGATVGEHAILSHEATCNQAICAIIQNNLYPYTYILLHLRKNMNSIIDQSSGSAQQNISQALIQRQKLIIPPSGIVKKFHEIVGPIFELVENNMLANNTLSQIRDSLLPRLMAGKIRVQ